ncbi:MAG: Rap1a/Tai family immunity protein [Labrys sp. (in: a-proteobacteria)]
MSTMLTLRFIFLVGALIFCTAAIFLPGGASADSQADVLYELSAGKLMKTCDNYDGESSNIDDSLNRRECIGFFMGYLAGVSAIRQYNFELNKENFNLWCAPKGVTIGQAIAIFVKWAKENPNAWHQRQAAAVAVALRQAFPCSE